MRIIIMCKRNGGWVSKTNFRNKEVPNQQEIDKMLGVLSDEKAKDGKIVVICDEGEIKNPINKSRNFNVPQLDTK